MPEMTQRIPLLPLDTWRRILGFHPWHFWGLADNEFTPISAQCSDLVDEYGFRGGDVGGRQDIRQALLDAEDKVLQEMGFAAAPRYTEEEVSWPEYPQTGLVVRSRGDVDGHWPSVTLSEGYVQSVGAESLTLLGTQPVSYSDADGDGLNDMFTVTIATDQTDPTKLAVYFAATDRWDGSAVSNRWRIEPVTVTISAGVATVKGRRWLAVKPVRYEGYEPDLEPIDPTDADNFVATLEVYQRTTDPTGTTVETAGIVFWWETLPWPSWPGVCCSGGGDSSGDPAAQASAVGRGLVRDSRLGIVTAGSSIYDSTSSTWGRADWGACRVPDKVTVRYLAGYPLEGRDVSPRFQRVIAMLASAEVPHMIHACKASHRRLHQWQFDRARAQGEMEEQYSISQRDLDNPFGTKLGQILAWREVERLRLIRAQAV